MYLWRETDVGSGLTWGFMLQQQRPTIRLTLHAPLTSLWEVGGSAPGTGLADSPYVAGGWESCVDDSSGPGCGCGCGGVVEAGTWSFFNEDYKATSTGWGWGQTRFHKQLQETRRYNMKNTHTHSGTELLQFRLYVTPTHATNE